jgi:transcriptional regulator with XRE-family HTH domain
MADPVDEAMVVFGNAVRAFRNAKGYTQEQVAVMINYSKGWMSNVETGQLCPTRKAVKALQTALAVSDDALVKLYDLLTRETLPVWLRDWLEEERRATQLRAFEDLLVYGLLQIEEYARVVMLGDEAATQDRMARQERLSADDAPKVFCILDEFVLHREIGSPEVMRAQLEHLVACVNSGIVIQIVPAAANPHRSGAFTLATVDEGEVAFIETAIRGMVTNGREDLKCLNECWESIRNQALPVGMSIELIKRTIEERWT